jgi:hypothetical protein
VRRFLLSAALVLACGILASSLALAAEEEIIYAGEDPETAGITLGGWGSGAALLNTKEGTAGPNAIEVRTDGYYSGARIDFSKPVDLSDALANGKNVDLVLTFRIPSLAGESEAGGYTTYGPRTGYAPGSPYSGYRPGGGAPTASTETPTPLISYMRVVLVVNGSKLVAEDQPLDYSTLEEGVLNVAIPLAAFQGQQPTTKPALLQRILIFGDRTASIYLGEIRTAVDDEEITVEPLDEMEINTGDRTEFTAHAEGGLSPLEYVWDFDASDGIQEEAYGPTVYHTYRKPGDYTVTVTVRDINHVKPPAKAEAVISVAQQ